ncbi:MAG: methyltransferase domain-containing protein [Sumerlaeia bacterium]
MGVAEKYFDHCFFPRLQVDAENINILNDQIDFIYSCSFIHHIPSISKLAEELYRITKPGGFYFASMEAYCPWWCSPK